MQAASSRAEPGKGLRANTQARAMPTSNAKAVATAATLSERISGNQSKSAGSIGLCMSVHKQ